MLKKPYFRAIIAILSYITFFYFFRLICLTLITFTVLKTNASTEHQPMIQKISDTFNANQIFIIGFSALLFAVFVHLMQPITKHGFKDFFPFADFNKHYAINGLSGFIFALVLTLACAASGNLSYLGVYLKTDEIAFSIFSALLLMVCFFGIIVVEEFLLRQVIEKTFLMYFNPMTTIAISSFTCLLIKYVQFDLTVMSAINVVLFNIVLSMVAHNEKSFLASAFFGTVYLSTLHAFFGLPYMQQDLAGIFLMRSNGDEGLGTLVSGGHYGPEAGLAMMVGFIIYMYLPQIRNRNG